MNSLSHHAVNHPQDEKASPVVTNRRSLQLPLIFLRQTRLSLIQYEDEVVNGWRSQVAEPNYCKIVLVPLKLSEPTDHQDLCPKATKNATGLKSLSRTKVRT